MKLVSAFAGLASLVFASQDVDAATRPHKALTCVLPGGSRTFVAPAKLGDLPKIELDYPSKVTLFSFRDGNFLVVAMDESESSRVRLVISAQHDKVTGAYEGQFVVDAGGNQLQLENGPVSCKPGP